MLKCKEISYIASDYLDGNLDWKKSLSVKFHLFICVHCKRFVRHLLSTIRCVQGMKRQTTTSKESSSILSLLPDQNE